MTSLTMPPSLATIVVLRDAVRMWPHVLDLQQPENGMHRCASLLNVPQLFRLSARESLSHNPS